MTPTPTTTIIVVTTVTITALIVINANWAIGTVALSAFTLIHDLQMRNVAELLLL